MKCPFCESVLHRVVDKRPVAGVGEIRRRRECLKCGRRFTTYEKIAGVELMVIKKDGRREAFNKEKLTAGLIKALEKRPALIRAQEVTDKIERKIRRKGNQQIASKAIGRMVLAELKKLDSVAYLRFMSVYRQFSRPDDFTKEVRALL
ncbi:MAG: Transcriptional repressor NrdR [Candidatus Daviesbacteria bacterium GW2011_GWB1_41_5]|uniref:Transcriptional repressor NrdR n=1 Tax=Candidatus Daviesbacteria bacterium GW2011_GWB1_41_5 TaxID=1618429 RepID=A0A0G0WH56_9BACT|nr:MAG: Transcriptional repressor NrdR [Candidatus Daviesbacteria bacterium GW2011_GWB1_41_5]